MSLFNTLRTSVSGLTAQSNALSAIGDNIANASTTGYKEANAQFETLLGNSSSNNYESGGVLTDIRYGVTDQGTLTTTTSATDLAIQGNGFFVVSQDGQGQYLTRAGSFVPDSNGNLTNAAGYELMGQAIVDGQPSPNLSVVNVSATGLQASPSTSATLTVNFPSTAATTAAADLPPVTASGATSPTATPTDVQYTAKTSLTVYDDLGQADVVDVYATKTDANTWQVTAYSQSDAAAGGGFPYSSADLGSTNVTFDATTGKVTGGTPLTINVPGGQSVAVDLGNTTQFATDFGVTTAQANGNAPSKLSSVKIGTDGTLTAVYASGFQVATYKIPVATVISPDNLTSINGNVYQTNQNSGNLVLATAGTGIAGTIQADSLESSTVDLATELTNMIQAQRGYEANSKVLQAASDLLSTLDHLNTN